jgi:hypothetical protein
MAYRCSQELRDATKRWADSVTELAGVLRELIAEEAEEGAGEIPADEPLSQRNRAPRSCPEIENRPVGLVERALRLAEGR